MKNLLFLVSLFLFLSMQVFSQVTIHVPADYTTIQAAINAANNGDIVLVAEGTYYENINFMGKAITVASHYYLDNKERHIRKTIINGSQPNNPDSGSVVYFASGEDTNSVLCGFTITGGTGTLENYPGYPPMCSGGGIFCSFSSAKIIHNRILDNKAANGQWGIGGGLSTGPPFIPTFVVVEGNEFINNEASGPGMVMGGGASYSSSGRVVNNIFRGNLACTIDAAASGGGLDVSSWDPTTAFDVIISGNIITHNKALQGDGGTYWIGGIGGGLDVLYTKAIITNNIIQHNEISAINNSFGAGILFDFPPDEVYFRNNIVSHNTFSGAGDCYGGGFAIWDGNPIIENNLFEKNDATLGGGGWIGDAFSFAKIINNTIIKNHADSKGGAIYTKSAAPTVMNSILWDNQAPDGPEIFVESGTIDVSYSDVKGGWAGTGNINLNPKMWPVLYLLKFNSPCIDAGNPDVMYNDPENPWHPGYALFPSRGLVRNDMGTYGGPGAIAWYDFLGKTSFEDEEVTASTPTSTEIKIDNYPNPFNAQTTIQMSLPADGFASLKVFNVLGQEVATIVSDNLTAGNYKYVWNANDVASGIYIYRLESNGLALDKKMILLK